MATAAHIPDMTFGDWLRKARKDAGYSQTRAGLAIGVSHPTLGGWERGRNFPSVDEFVRLIRVYDAPWLLELLASMVSGSPIQAYIPQVSDRELYDPDQAVLFDLAA